MPSRKRHARFFLLFIFLCLAVPVGTQQPAAGLTILLTNDDGYDAPGLKALIEALQPLGEIYVSAPATEKSGASHGITTTRDPIFVAEHKQPGGSTWYAVEAPPATCVRLAIKALLPKRPDLVISGINRGENLGVLIYYSGTLGAAREAALVGLPAIAVSMRGNNEKDYATAAAFVRQLVEQLGARQMLKPGFFLNVNVPAGEAKGVQVTRLSLTPTLERYERRTSPHGRLYFWSAWKPLEDDEEGTDVWAFERGYITLTPMGTDVTATQNMDALRRLRLKARAAASE